MCIRDRGYIKQLTEFAYSVYCDQCASVYQCIIVYTDVPVPTRLYQCVPVCTNVYQCVPVCTNVYQCVPVCALYISVPL